MEGEECPALAPPGHAVTLSRDLCHAGECLQPRIPDTALVNTRTQNTIIIQHTPFKIENCRYKIQGD